MFYYCGWCFEIGVFLDNAQELLKQPALTEDDLLRRFKVAVRDAHAFGLTSIHDAGLDPTSLEGEIVSFSGRRCADLCKDKLNKELYLWITIVWA
jgi:hypothetical protein